METNDVLILVHEIRQRRLQPTVSILGRKIRPENLIGKFGRKIRPEKVGRPVHGQPWPAMVGLDRYSTSARPVLDWALKTNMRFFVFLHCSAMASLQLGPHEDLNSVPIDSEIASGHSTRLAPVD